MKKHNINKLQITIIYLLNVQRKNLEYLYFF